MRRSSKEASSMMIDRFRNKSCAVAGGGLSLLLLLSGCGGGDVGSELTVRPTPRSLSSGERATLRLPQDEPFSITLAPTRESPGLGGTAEADAHVSRDGNADAVARVDEGGSALARFQLGHAVKNESDRQMDLLVRLRCEYETEAEATPPGPLPDATVGLKLYARDGHNRLLRNIGMVDHSTEEGAASSKDRKDVEFTLTLGPRETLSVFLAGSVEIETRVGHSARGSIKLSGLEMQIETALAPPVRQAGDEQP
jgi:hypothetical protein